jgi:hypothetical protein
MENGSEDKVESQTCPFIQSPFLRSLTPIPLMRLVALIHPKLQSPNLLLRVSYLNAIIMTVTFQQQFWMGHSNQSSPQCVIATLPASGDGSQLPPKGIFLSFLLFPGHKAAEVPRGHHSVYSPAEMCSSVGRNGKPRDPQCVLGVMVSGAFIHLLLHSLHSLIHVFVLFEA